MVGLDGRDAPLARRTAEEWVRSRPDFQQRCREGTARFKEDALTRARLAHVRLLKLEGAARTAEEAAVELEAAVAAAVAEGAMAPIARVDAAGAVILSPVRLNRP